MVKTNGNPWENHRKIRKMVKTMEKEKKHGDM
jgi:hypothetical protein